MKILSQGLAIHGIWKHYVSAFIGGFVTLALEIAALRAFAPFFGYSIHTTSTLIGLVLFALAIGYWIGGQWGDGQLSLHTYAKLLFAGAVYIFLVLATYQVFLPEVASLSVVWGTAVASAALLAVPMTIFATISPYFVSHTTYHLGGAGTSAGTLYAAGTIGSLLGVFLTSLWLIPTFGLWQALLAIAAVATLPSILLARQKSRLVFAVLAFVLVATSLIAKNETQNAVVLEKTQSPYSYLEVVDVGNQRMLRAERRTGAVYSLMQNNGTWNYSSKLYNLFALPPLLTQNKSQALLLGAGGTIPFIYEDITPNTKLTVVDIDPEVVRLSRKYLFLNERKNISHVEIADARRFLRNTKETYNIINMDLFHGTEIPFYLATREFFALTKARLSPNGILAVNVFKPCFVVQSCGGETRFADVVSNTIADTYPYVYRVKAERGSHFILGMHAPITLDRLKSLAEREHAAHTQATLNYLAGNIKRVTHNSKLLVLTDNHAPVERFSSVR